MKLLDWIDRSEVRMPDAPELEIQPEARKISATLNAAELLPAAPELPFKSDPTYQAELQKMDNLDAKVNPGRRMGADVESSYRALIAEHEQDPQSEVDRGLAIAGRLRMIDTFANSGDRTKLVDMAVETSTKYPEILNYRQFLSAAASGDLQNHPQFKLVLDGATDEQRARFSSMSALRDSEKSELDAVLLQMDALDTTVETANSPSAALQLYWDLVEQHEGQPQSRVDRRIASFGRARIIDHMNSTGENPATTLETMRASMNMYPEMTTYKNFLVTAAGLRASDNPAWMTAFTTNGGDTDRLKDFER